MIYSTSDLLRDSFPPLESLEKLTSSFIARFKSFFDKVIDFDYDIYAFRIVENLPYGALIVFLGFLGVFTLTKYTEEKAGVRIITITTASMSPQIYPGSIIVTTPSHVYKKGDVVTYKEINSETGLESGRAITHRIVEVLPEDKFIMKGDANENPDPEVVAANQVLGKLLVVVPLLGYVDVALKTPLGFVVLVAAPALILIKNELKFIKGELTLLRLKE